MSTEMANEIDRGQESGEVARNHRPESVRTSDSYEKLSHPATLPELGISRQRLSELATMAGNLSRNCGYHVFPCAAERKMPCWGKREGGRGFYDATTDPAEIDRLFRHHHAELIGVRTGQTSGISVLDVDVKHDSARAWWIKNEARLPSTRTYRTRSGGLHLFFCHAAGVRNSEGVPVKGIDTRGEGGYIIFWFAAGFECLDHAPPAPWPHWLSGFFWPPPPALSTRYAASSEKLSNDQLERVKQRAISRCRDAAPGTLHCRVRSSARLLGGIQDRVKFADAAAIDWLLAAAGLKMEKKARDTIEWGLAKGRENPLRVGIRL